MEFCPCLLDDPEGLALVGKNYQPKAPTLTFSERCSLHVGNHTFELFYLPGHTESNIGIYLLPEKVFFSGDNVTSKTQPSLDKSFPLDWVESLKKIEAFDIDFIVPGHGEVCDREEARRFHLFLQQCIGMITDAIKKGMTIGEAADKLSFEDLYPGKGTGFAVHPGPEQQRRNVFRL
ncbi:MBL fold metallo-hydrolase, partial [Chloroflexota bacterium]